MSVRCRRGGGGLLVVHTHSTQQMAKSCSTEVAVGFGQLQDGQHECGQHSPAFYFLGTLF